MAKKIKGKEWYTIIAPSIFDKKVLGETPVDDIKKLKWRKISVPLVNITNDMSKYYFKVCFRVIDISGKTANTDFAGLECLRDYIARMVRHGTNRMDNVQELLTKDGKKIIIKTIIITNRKVTQGLKKELNAFIKQNIERAVLENNLDNFILKVIDDSVKSKLINTGSKIYPIRNFEFRKIEIPVK